MQRLGLRRRPRFELLEDRTAPAFGVATGISLTPAGTATGNNASYFDVRSISADGTLEVFASDATNLVAADANGTTDIFVRNLNTGATSLVSVNSSGTNSGNFDSYQATISADGRYVAFVSQATNLTANVMSGYQVFRRDLLTGTTVLVSLNSGGAAAANDWSQAPTLSSDGRHVAFLSYGDNLVGGLSDLNGAADIFVRDMQLGLTKCVSVTPAGTTTGDADSFESTIANDGSTVVFRSSASNLASGVTDNNGTTDLFVRNLASNTTSLLSKALTTPATGMYPSDHQGRTLSADGRYEVFTGLSYTHVHGIADLNGATDVFVRDLVLGTTSLVSVNFAGTQSANSGSDQAAISANGRYVVFRSFASDLTAASISGGHLYRRDLLTNTTTLVDFKFTNTIEANGGPEMASISSDGRYIAFASWADDLVSGIADTNFDNDIFVRDMVLGTTKLASISSSGTSTGNVPANNPVLSADGLTVVFQSASTNLVAGVTDNNGLEDLFVRNLATNSTMLASRVEPGASTGDQRAFRGLQPISDDGRYEVFAGGSALYVAGVVDLNQQPDVFLRDRVLGTNTLVSRSSVGLAAGNAGSFDASISGNGRYVIFYSDATDLVATPVSGIQLFRWDRITNAMALVTVNSAGSSGTTGVYDATISDDGNVVAFSSAATNLVATSDTNFGEDVFARNMTTGITTLVSLNSAGTAAGNGISAGALVSGDGARVAFTSSASNLTTTSDLNGTSDAFVRTLAGGPTKLASLNSAGTAAASGNATSLSNDGNIVAFESASGGIAPSDLNGFNDVFVYNVTSNAVSVVSLNSAGTSTGTNSSFQSYVSGNGAFVVFASNSTTIHALPSFSFGQVYRRNLAAGTTQLISVNSAGTAGGNNHSEFPHCSDDGNLIAFESSATNLPGVANNGNKDIYFRNVGASSTTFVSINSAGSNSGNAPSTGVRVSADGGHLTWITDATDLLAGVSDYNGADEDIYAHAVSGGVNDLVSAKGAGTFAAYGGFATPSVSANGQKIAWVEQSGTIFAKDANGESDIVLFDTTTSSNSLVSFNSTGSGGGGDSSFAPIISANGQIVAFISAAFNLVGNDGNGNDFDVFVRNTTAGTTELISVNSAGTASGIGDCFAIAMSADGNIVAFVSTGINYVGGVADANAAAGDIFVRNRTAGTTVVASANSTGTATTTGPSSEPVVSDDGSRLTFESEGTNLLAGVVDFNGTNLDVFARNIGAGTTALVSIRAAGTFTGNNTSDVASVSDDGQRIAFHSWASDLTANDVNVFEDVFYWNAGAVALVSLNSAGTTSGNNLSRFASISGNGLYIAFSSRSSNLTALDTNGIGDDVFRRDLNAGTTALVSVNSLGTGSGNNVSERSAISANGATIAFESRATNLVGTTDSNGNYDVFVYSFLTASMAMASRNASAAGNGASDTPVLSANGSTVVFSSAATNLVAGVVDANGWIDVFANRQGDVTAPTIAAVYFDGSTWTGAFRAAAGDATYGYPAQTGVNQLRTMPWSTINTVYIKFSENVAIVNGNLGVRGSNVASYVTSLNYDPVNFVAKFTLAGSIDTDRVILDLDGDSISAVADAAGNRLAGSWTESSSTFPTAGAAAVDFKFRFVVAVGDVSRDGLVRNADLNAVRNNLFIDIGAGGYSILTDIDGNGLLRNADLNATRNHLFIDAPPGPGPFGFRRGPARLKDSPVRDGRSATLQLLGSAVGPSAARSAISARRPVVALEPKSELLDALFAEF